MSAPHMQSLDADKAALRGINLVEASAGTGKTRTLETLFLRLLTEGKSEGEVTEADAPLAVDRILVVTFARAATAELRDRIRSRLADELALAESVADALRIARLTSALRGFDQAAIYTIHSFCQRVLQDAAFESGVAFDAELIPNEEQLQREIAQDFWRLEFSSGEDSPLRRAALAQLTSRVRSPLHLLQSVSRFLARDYVRFDVPERVANPEPVWQALVDAFHQAVMLWQAGRAEIVEMLVSHPGLSHNPYNKKNVPAWAGEIDVWFGGGDAGAAAPKSLFRFAAREIAQKEKPDGGFPGHAFFAVCEVLADAAAGWQAVVDAESAHVRLRLIDYARAELAARKAALGRFGYDDLINNLDHALSGPNGKALAAVIRERYPAALIDEFQDTDPVQYRIFRAIYATGVAVPGTVFFVGDPKQAIYRFRGADVFAYLAARNDADAVYSLDTNWRSDAALLDGLNALLGHNPDPFFGKHIAYREVNAARQGNALATQDGHAPLTLWWVPGSEEGKKIGKAQAEATIIRAVALETARLLGAVPSLSLMGEGLREREAVHQAADGTTTISDKDGRIRSLNGGDIAVLVRKKAQADAVRKALAAQGIQSVLVATASVFGTQEAWELERVLLAVARPHDSGVVKSALMTPLFGVAAAALVVLEADPVAWTARVEALQGYRAALAAHGFMHFFRSLLAAEGAAARVLTGAEGERRMTNYMHLAELLQAEALTLSSSLAQNSGELAALIAFLRAARQEAEEEGSEAGEERQLRLESDENLVKIATIHAAKGLEYPVTFCPFLWDGYQRQIKIAEYHDPVTDCAAADFGSPRREEAERFARAEAFADELRVAYVAATRARHRCYLAWGAIEDADTGPLAWWLFPPAQAVDDPLALKGRFKETKEVKKEGDLRARVETLALKAGGHLRVESLPDARALAVPAAENATFERTPRLLRASPPAGWRVLSFSTLSATGSGGGGAHARIARLELPDYDTATDDAADSVATDAADAMGTATSAFDFSGFPRGAAAGIFMHSVFERVDFRDAQPNKTLPVIEQQLAIAGLAQEWAPGVAEMVGRVLAAPLLPGKLQLADIGEDARLIELEFFYSIRGVGKTTGNTADSRGEKPDPAFSTVAPKYAEAIKAALAAAQSDGYMKGFIDLVFCHDGRYYLADWKSNWLGASPADYTTTALEAAMAREGYYLQYLIYALALHRYLKLRVPDYRYEIHFGGVYYLFVRGMGFKEYPGHGVYFDKPDAGFIEALDRVFSPSPLGGDEAPIFSPSPASAGEGWGEGGAF